MWLARLRGSLDEGGKVPGVLFLLAGISMGGCASPGPPRPPSLFIPRTVTDLAATRTGDAVTLRFTVPALSTDGQPLRAVSLIGGLCRQDALRAPCSPVDLSQTAKLLPVPGPGTPTAVLWTDPLPSPLHSGTPRPIVYRVELKTGTGASAGYSDPVYSAAGAAPPPVSEFRAEGTRVGVELHWIPVSGGGEVMLRRMEPDRTTVPARGAVANSQEPAGTTSTKHKGHARSAHGGYAFTEKHADADPGVVWLQAAPGAEAAAATIDNSIDPGTLYRYTAVRRQRVQAGGRTLELESSPSAEVAIMWRDVYPPTAPTGLMALGYQVPVAPQKPPGYAVDLVWEPVEDGQLAGYLVFRQALEAGETSPPDSAVSQLTPQPIAMPGFHDPTASPGERYRYTVFAVGTNGQRSAAVSAEVTP